MTSNIDSTEDRHSSGPISSLGQTKPELNDLVGDLKAYIRDVPDFPKKGILFRDITPLLRNNKMFVRAIDAMYALSKGIVVNSVACIEARGFVFGAALAHRGDYGITLIRKSGKLPPPVDCEAFSLEYGTDKLEICSNDVAKGDNVLIVDDVLATGGTAAAVSKMIRRSGGNVVGAMFLIELTELKGRAALEGIPLFSIIKY